MATCGGKADLVFHGGEVLAAEGDPLAAPVPGGGFRVRDCLGVRDGRVVFPEGRGGWRELAGPATETVDLRGSAVLPGIVDAHLHPLWGARTLAGASLGYEPLSMEGTIGRLRDLLARDAGACPDGLLLVRCWQRHGGADLTAADLDALETRRPVLLLSGDCHTVCLNRRAMEVFRDFLAGADPPDGRILRDGAGRPGGLVEDGPAFRLYDHASRQEAREAAETLRRGLAALNRQGVTSVMDARATPEALEAADLLWEEDALTVRLSGAWELTPDRCPSPGDAERAVREAAEAMRGYRRGPDAGAGAWPDARVRPGVSLRHLKFFVDGMPGNATARLRSPYLAAPGPSGRPAPLPPAPPGGGRGLAYFDAPRLAALFLAAARAGLHPHCHAIADGALDIVLAAAQAAREGFPGRDLRPAAAHLDLVSPDQYARMRELGVAAVLSFQWAGLEPADVEELLAMYGPGRLPGCETHGRFLDAGIVTAYGSDWPVEGLDQWRNFQTGALRRIPGGAGPGHPRLDTDRDLSIAEILSAATRSSAWILGLEGTAGALAEGMPADLAVVEGPLLAKDPAALAGTRVTRTLVGGRTVWRAG